MVKFAEILFNPKGKLALLPNLAIGNNGVPGINLSSARTAGARGRTAKMCSCILALEAAVEGRLTSYSNGNIVYTEVSNRHGDFFCGTFDGQKMSFSLVPTRITDLALFLTPFLLDPRIAPITAASAERCLSDFSEDNAFQFCDDAYFEGKTKVGEIETDAFLNPDIIKQGIRTGNLTRLPILDALGNVPALKICDGTEEVEAQAETEAADTVSKFLDECKTGTHILDYIWDNPEQAAEIVPLNYLDGFVPSEHFCNMAKIITYELNQVISRMNKGTFGVKAIDNNYVNIQLVGRPGTGKTTVVNALSASLGLPIKVVINSKHTEEDTFQGMTKVQDGKVTFAETPFLSAYKNGGIILLEEFNLPDAGVMMGALGQAIEKPFLLYEDGFKEVRRHPLCVIVATANIGTHGSKEPSEAIVSRMPNIFLLDDPKQEEFLEILQKNSDAPMKTCKRVYTAYTKTINFLCSSRVSAEDVAMNVTLRACIAALKQINMGIGFHSAIKNTIIGAIAVKDIAMANDTYQSVIAPMPD